MMYRWAVVVVCACVLVVVVVAGGGREGQGRMCIPFLQPVGSGAQDRRPRVLNVNITRQCSCSYTAVCGWLAGLDAGA